MSNARGLENKFRSKVMQKRKRLKRKTRQGKMIAFPKFVKSKVKP